MGRFLLNFQKLKDDKGQPSSWIQVFKLGEFEHPMGDFVVDHEFLEMVKTNFYELKTALKSDDHVIPIDYNHAGLADGDISLAAGWITDVEIREDGLYAKVSWTKKAADHIREGEFKYISPEFSPKGTKNEFGDEIEGPFLHAAALTNRPFLSGMADVNLKKPKKGEPMQDLFKVLNCKDEKEAQEKITALQESETELSAAREALKLKEGEKLVEAVKNLKDEHTKTIEANTALKEEIKGLNAKDLEREADKQVDEAQKAGKITAAQREWAKKYALKDPDGFSEYVEKTPKIVEYEEIGSNQSPEDEGNAIEKFNKLIEAKAAEINPENPKAAWAQAYKVVRKENIELAQEAENSRRLKVIQK